MTVCREKAVTRKKERKEKIYASILNIIYLCKNMFLMKIFSWEINKRGGWVRVRGGVQIRFGGGLFCVNKLIRAPPVYLEVESTSQWWIICESFGRHSRGIVSESTFRRGNSNIPRVCWIFSPIYLRFVIVITLWCLAPVWHGKSTNIQNTYNIYINIHNKLFF